jgi:hypothetical protein
MRYSNIIKKTKKPPQFKYEYKLLLDRDLSIPVSVPRLLPDLTVYMSKSTGVLWEGGTARPSRTPEFSPDF